jgi:hypothetical protein
MGHADCGVAMQVWHKNLKKMLQTSNTSKHLAAVFWHVWVGQCHALELRDALPA